MILKLADAFPTFNFDMMQALVEELNRYNETVEETLKMMNIFPEGNEGTTYKIILQDSRGMKIIENATVLDPFDFVYHVHVSPIKEIDMTASKDGNKLSEVDDLFDSLSVFSEAGVKAKSPWDSNSAPAPTTIQVKFSADMFKSCNIDEGTYTYEDDNTGTEIKIVKNPRKDVSKNIHLLIA